MHKHKQLTPTATNSACNLKLDLFIYSLLCSEIINDEFYLEQSGLQ